MLVQIGKDYKEVQRMNTIQEMERKQENGVQKISFSEMENLLSEIGLTLDMNENSYLLLSYNSSNEDHYFEATTSPLDEKKISVYNVNSEFYNRELKGFKTEKGRRLGQLRNDYFTTITKRGIEYILWF